MKDKRKFEVIGYTIWDNKSDKFVKKTCSHFFQKKSQMESHKNKLRPKYKIKYRNKTIDNIKPDKTIEKVKFGKDIYISFTTRRR